MKYKSSKLNAAIAKATATTVQTTSPEDQSSVHFDFVIKRIDRAQRIVTGEVYAPYIIDTHGEMMEPEDVQHMAHAWMMGGSMNNFDIMHDNIKVSASTVESFIAKGHPDYSEGAWVLSSKVHDDALWKKVRRGEIGGWSVEAMVYKVPSVVEFDHYPIICGLTEVEDGHRHFYVAFVNEDGVVTRGFTSEVDGHKHIIDGGTRTGMAEKHAHRFHLP